MNLTIDTDQFQHNSVTHKRRCHAPFVHGVVNFNTTLLFINISRMSDRESDFSLFQHNSVTHKPVNVCIGVLLIIFQHNIVTYKHIPALSRYTVTSEFQHNFITHKLAIHPDRLQQFRYFNTTLLLINYQSKILGIQVVHNFNTTLLSINEF